jgi:drug/metabolite transporter (DMT)-like permease
VHTDRPLARSIFLMLGATLCFAVLDATAKHLARTYPVPMLVWARYLVHFVLMLFLLAPSLRWKLVATRRPGRNIVRALLLVAITGLNFAALRLLPLAETTALLFVTPLLVGLLAAPLLGERLSAARWLASLAGFGGVLLIARPGGILDPTGLVLALGAAGCYAIYQIQTRVLSATETPVTMLFYTALVGTVSLSLAAPLYWSGPFPDAADALRIALLGILGGTGHYLLIRAFAGAPASVLSPFLYFQLVWATLLGWFAFDHWPDGTTLLGMAIIAAGSLALALMPRPVPPDRDTTC